MVQKSLSMVIVAGAFAWVGLAHPGRAAAQTTLHPPIVAPACTATGVQLRWMPSPGASYQILSSVNNSPYVQIGSVSPFQTNFLVPGAPAVSLKLKVRAVGAFGVFADSQPIFITDPRIMAMLDVIAFAEGTAGLGNEYGKVVNGRVVNSPYYPALRNRNNVSVTNFTRHPAILVQVTPTLQSTAAGRYQFRLETWNGLSMPDFTPNSQDAAAIKLLQRRNMIMPLQQGQFRQAVYNGAREWASLPTASGLSYYRGQPARSITQLETAYAQALAQRSR